jgi:hypothetical protein
MLHSGLTFSGEVIVDIKKMQFGGLKLIFEGRGLVLATDAENYDYIRGGHVGCACAWVAALDGSQEEEH